MHPLLEQVFQHKSFINSRGENVEVNSETSRGQCEFLQRLIEENGFKNTLEVGCAYGISTVAILEKMSKIQGRHCAMDIFQEQDWNNNGLDLVRLSGLEPYFEFHEDYSYKVLPRLIDQGRKFDFAYVDSTKVFDWLLVDFFLIDKLLSVNGIIVFDDTGYYSVRKLSRFISRLPHYEVESPYPINVRPPLISRLTGKLRSASSLLRSSLNYEDYALGINSACTAFRKTGEDQRDWKWHKDF